MSNCCACVSPGVTAIMQKSSYGHKYTRAAPFLDTYELKSSARIM